jgi:hypothetical protein
MLDSITGQDASLSSRDQREQSKAALPLPAQRSTTPHIATPPQTHEHTHSHAHTPQLGLTQSPTIRPGFIPDQIHTTAPRLAISEPSHSHERRRGTGSEQELRGPNAPSPQRQHTTTALPLVPGQPNPIAIRLEHNPLSQSEETVPGSPSMSQRLAAAPPPSDFSASRPLTDRLGTLVRRAAEALERMSFEELCVQHRGPSCLTGGTLIPHPAATILRRLKEVGAPVSLSGPEWTPADLDAAVLRGAHRSTSQCREFLREEFADMMEAGQWLVLPYAAVQHLIGLRLSPTGVVPQANRRGRTIVDYLFSFVNQETKRLAPDSLQFGWALPRILQRLQRADTRRGPIYLAKIDVADAFMRVAILAAHIPALGALLPSHPGEELLVAFPLILPMGWIESPQYLGWIESPQYLCAVTETVADMANELFAQGHHSPTPHRLDALANSRPVRAATAPEPKPFTVPPPCVRSQGPLQQPLNAVDVYMDDFILISQGSRADRVSSHRIVFDCIDSVLRPLSPGDNPKRKEPNSTKKLAQGDAAWATQKTILGWKLDTARRTIELPMHRLDRLHLLLSSIERPQRRTSRRKWQQLVGELRSMVLAIPGGRGLFSQLQSVITYDPDPKPSDRLQLSPAVHDQLDDFRWLISSLSTRPTRWGELVDSEPLFLGTVDASGTGMGGVWLDPTQRLPPLLWRFAFPAALISRLVSADHKSGSVTNSDFEQAGTVCQTDILALQYDIREATIVTFTDNTAALSREQRGSTSVDAPAAYLC